MPTQTTYDVRKLMDASSRLRDGKELHVPMPSLIRKGILHKVESTQVGELLKEFHLLADHS